MNKKYMPCPCGSKQLYHKCCKVFHDGTPAPTAEKLMRSRYSAYAVGDVGYIMRTTHPENPAYTPDRDRWRADLLNFSQVTTFVSLSVDDTADGATSEEAFVTFTASLMQGGEDASFTERSKFYKVDGNWLYHSGEITQGIKKT